MTTLDVLAARYGTDKGDPHGYTTVYDHWFTPLRTSEVSVLELGWGGYEDPDAGGASARMWRDYFPRGRITVLDRYYKRPAPSDHGITLFQGSQDDPTALGVVIAGWGPFDVVIDDCSHEPGPTIRSFELLWPHITRGGYYCIEDTGTSYLPWYGGTTDPDHPAPSTMRFAKSLADSVNHQHLAPEYEPHPLVAMVAFYPGLVIIRKTP